MRKVIESPDAIPASSLVSFTSKGIVIAGIYPGISSCLTSMDFSFDLTEMTKPLTWKTLRFVLWETGALEVARNSGERSQALRPSNIVRIKNSTQRAINLQNASLRWFGKKQN